jgi:hypothetical protein
MRKIVEDHVRIIQNKVMIPVKLRDLPPNNKALSATKVMKKTVNRYFRARITGLCF